MERWAALAALGAEDLCVARLAEGHADAVAILAEAGRRPADGLYGVWASRSGGALRLVRSPGSATLSGTMRFCSGAGLIDRALIAAVEPPPEGDPGAAPVDRLIEVDLRDRRVAVDPGAWPAVGMDASMSADVHFDDLPVGAGSLIGPAGFYTGRCGFAAGGAGVAVVWLGGTAGALEDAASTLAGSPVDPHRAAHLGALHTSVTAAAALLEAAAARIDADPAADHRLMVATCRAAAEAAAREAIDRIPRILGPASLGRRRWPGQHLADLQLYIRQHHGEADLAALGEQLVPGPAIPGPAFPGPAFPGPAFPGRAGPGQKLLPWR